MNRELHMELTRPFDEKKIKWRVGSRTKDKKKGMMLAYIDARDVQQRLDSILEPWGWQNKINVHPNGSNVCELSVLVDGVWITKSDGAGMTDVESEKGGISDAFKRSAVQWGIGRYLYYLDSPWAELQNGYAPRNFTHPMPAWAQPANWEKYYKTMFGGK